MYGEALLLERGRARDNSLVARGEAEIAEQYSNDELVAEPPLDGQTFLVERRRACIVPLTLGENAQVVQRDCDVPLTMSRAEESQTLLKLGERPRILTLVEGG